MVARGSGEQIIVVVRTSSGGADRCFRALRGTEFALLTSHTAKGSSSSDITHHTARAVCLGEAFYYR